MSSGTGLLVRIFGAMVALSAVRALDRIELYPFGDVHRDQRLSVGDDVSSPSVHLITPITFYDDKYTSLYINLNGIISFDTELPDYRSNLIIPFDYKVISPFFADVDITLSGNVYYRETQDPSLLNKVAQDIQKAFPQRYDFRPRSLLIATWDSVAAFESQFEPTNTFQVLIASDGTDSFCLFLYPADGINWVRGHGKDSPQHEDVPAQAGFDSGEYGLYYTLPGSGNNEVQQLSTWSNVGRPGVWVFQIGATHGKNIVTPDLGAENGPVRDSGVASCAAGGDRLCHVNARCTDYSRGFCCACVPPYIGNGYQCISADESQRVSGKVTGSINGEQINGVDLHAYVVTKEGRTYTAISRIPASIGYTMQSLYTVGSTLGFVFALPQGSGDKNGFMIAGGQFNRTATVQFQPSGERFSLKQTYEGQDAQGHMRMTTRVDGNLPQITSRSKVEVDDYKEEYRRPSPGVIKSYSTQTLRVDGTPYQITVDQTINYSECEERPLSDISTIRLNVTRNFVVYSDSEQIVRYSQTNKISTTSGGGGLAILGEMDHDLCRNTRCGPNAHCAQEGDAFGCVCKPGFVGNGYVGCTVATCDTIRVNCHADASCEYDYSTSAYACKCNPGFTGDGYYCSRYTDVQRPPVPVPGRDCSQAPGVCDHNAQCVWDHTQNKYACRCREGFSGDGLRCIESTDGQQTVALQPSIDCRRDPRLCDRNARCEPRGAQFVCVCNPGFQGDGYRSCTQAGDRSNYLLYAQGMYIMEASADSRQADTGKQTLYIPGQLAIGIDVDCMRKYFYWTDVTGKAVSKAKLDGTDSRTIVTNLGSPEGVSVDWLSENVYWTDSVLDRIEVSKFDGSQRKTLFSTDLVNPRAIAVDPLRGVMFWTDWNRAAPKIEKANMDGSDRQVIVSDGLGLPNGLTIDFDSNNVCWADAGTRKVECTNYDGRNRRLITQSAGYPFGLVYNRDVFFWTDWERTSLPNTNKNSNRPNEDITLPTGANGKLYGVTVVKNSCPPGSNQCQYNNGGCRYLCLPTSSGGRTCACPDNISQDECSRTALL